MSRHLLCELFCGFAWSNVYIRLQIRYLHLFSCPSLKLSSPAGPDPKFVLANSSSLHTYSYNLTSILQQLIMFIVDSRVGPAGTTFIITEFCITIIYLGCCYFSGCRHQTSVGKKQDYRYLQINLMRHILFELGWVGDAIYDRYATHLFSYLG